MTSILLLASSLSLHLSVRGNPNPIFRILDGAWPDIVGAAKQYQQDDVYVVSCFMPIDTLLSHDGVTLHVKSFKSDEAFSDFVAHNKQIRRCFDRLFHIDVSLVKDCGSSLCVAMYGRSSRVKDIAKDLRVSELSFFAEVNLCGH